MENEKQKELSKLSQEIGAKEARKLRARKQDKKSIWLGFGFFGLVGWSIAIPVVLGTALGLWLDKRYPMRFSWTLTLLVAGLFGGILNVWHWIDKENQEINKELEDDGE